MFYALFEEKNKINHLTCIMTISTQGYS